MENSTIMVDKSLSKRLSEYCKKYGFSKVGLTTRIIREYLDFTEERERENDG